MSEFSEFAWGIPDVKRDLSYPSLTDEESPATAIAAFKALILERPDVGFLRTDTDFILRFLRARKFNAQEAFEVYVNYYHFMHRNHQNFYVGYNIKNPEIRGALEDGLPGVLETRDKRGRRIMIISTAQWDSNRYPFLAIHKAMYLSLENLAADLVVQERGIILVVDWTGFTFRQCSRLQPTSLRSLIECIEYSFPIRFKAIHFIGQSWYVEAAVSALLRAFLRDKSRNKLHFHGTNLSNLHQFLPREVLPCELGGEKGPYQSSRWIALLTGSSENSNGDIS